MPVIINSNTDKAVGFRCQQHRDVPQLNVNVKFTDGHSAECALCCVDQATDALLAQLGEIVDKAAKRLDFFEEGTGTQLRTHVAEIMNSLSHNTPQTDEAKELQ